MLDKDYLNFLISLKLISRPILRKLRNMFQSWRSVFMNLNNENLNKVGLSYEQIDQIMIAKQNIDIDRIFEEYTNYGISYISIDEKGYPFLLKQIVDPPLLLYFKGDILNFNKNIAIVGTRKSTFYGNNITKLLADGLSKRGITIISGLAFGIDAIAHKSAMKNIGKTIAILGSSLERFLPAGNEKLGEQIIENGGCIISEYPLFTSPSRFSFPERNRIIAGLADAVIVTEAAKKSGAKITVKYALEEGREVFAVPGSINSEVSKGTNELISQGAHVVTSVEDVLDVLHWDDGINQKQLLCDSSNLSNDELSVLKIIKTDPVDISYIMGNLNINIKLLIKLLSTLELHGFIKSTSGKYYR